METELMARARGLRCLGDASITARLACAVVAKSREPPRKKNIRNGRRDVCTVAEMTRTFRG